MEPHGGKRVKILMKRKWKWLNEKSSQFAREEDQRKGTSCPHFSPPGCSLTIKVNWLHLHSELSEPSHLLGLQFHPVPAALIKSHTLFFSSPIPNFTLPPTVFFSALPARPPPPPPCPHSIYTPTPTRLLSGGQSECATFLLKQVWHEGRTRRQPTDMAFHIIQAQHSSPVVVVVALVFLLHASAQLELDYLGGKDKGGNYLFVGISARRNKKTKKKKKKRRIYSDENNVTFASKSCFFFLFIRRYIFFICRTCSFIHYEKKPFAEPLKGKEARVGI